MFMIIFSAVIFTLVIAGICWMIALEIEIRSIEKYEEENKGVEEYFNNWLTEEIETYVDSNMVSK